MKKIVFAVLALLAISCNNNTPAAKELNILPQTDISDYKEQKVNDKWIPDKNTVQELLALQNTVENFNLLKTKMQTVAAYYEYGNLLQRHIDRINSVCIMKGEPSDLLKSQLDQLKSKIPLLQNSDMQKSLEASNQLTETLNQIESTFLIEY